MPRSSVMPRSSAMPRSWTQRERRLSSSFTLSRYAAIPGRMPALEHRTVKTHFQLSEKNRGERRASHTAVRRLQGSGPSGWGLHGPVTLPLLSQSQLFLLHSHGLSLQDPSSAVTDSFHTALLNFLCKGKSFYWWVFDLNDTKNDLRDVLQPLLSEKPSRLSPHKQGWWHSTSHSKSEKRQNAGSQPESWNLFPV